MTAKKTQNWIVALIGIIFVLPPLCAGWFYYHHGAWLTGRINHGHLLTKPLDMTQLPMLDEAGAQMTAKRIQGKWHLWLVQQGPCDKPCRRALYTLDQVRLAMGKDAARVRRMVTTTTSTDDKSVADVIFQNYTGMQHTLVNSAQLQTFLQSMDENDKTRILTNGGMFIVDPIGNVVLSYPYDEKPTPLFDDLHHLLNVSQIG